MLLDDGEDYISDIVLSDMGPEQGHLWIYDVNDEATEAFTEFGMEHMAGLIADRATRKADP